MRDLKTKDAKTIGTVYATSYISIHGILASHKRSDLEVAGSEEARRGLGCDFLHRNCWGLHRLPRGTPIPLTPCHFPLSPFFLPHSIFLLRLSTFPIPHSPLPVPLSLSTFPIFPLRFPHSPIPFSGQVSFPRGGEALFKAGSSNAPMPKRSSRRVGHRRTPE